MRTSRSSTGQQSTVEKDLLFPLPLVLHSISFSMSLVRSRSQLRRAREGGGTKEGAAGSKRGAKRPHILGVQSDRPRRDEGCCCELIRHPIRRRPKRACERSCSSSLVVDLLKRRKALKQAWLARERARAGGQQESKKTAQKSAIRSLSSLCRVRSCEPTSRGAEVRTQRGKKRKRVAG